MSADLGRLCPIRYRYGAQAIAKTKLVDAEILYVIGGLYENLPALDTVEAMAQAENAAVTICFNDDFNWFNVDDHAFNEINRRILKHHAIAIIPSPHPTCYGLQTRGRMLTRCPYILTRQHGSNNFYEIGAKTPMLT